jgi:hypothetical protein
VNILYKYKDRKKKKRKEKKREYIERIRRNKALKNGQD